MQNTSFDFEQTSAYRLRHQLELLVTASAVTDVPAIVVGPPGYGKSEILFYASEQMHRSEKEVQFLECSPATPASLLKGYQNPAWLLDRAQAAQDGEPDWIYDGTPYDPTVNTFIFDEVNRLAGAIQHTLISLLHDVGKIREHRPVYLATANWLNYSPQTAAIFDRFGLTFIHEPVPVDIEAVIRVDPISTWTFDVPYYEDVLDCREQATLNDGQYETIIGYLSSLQELMIGTRFNLNNRRTRQWLKIAERVSFIYAGGNNWTELPAQFHKIMESAYPITEEDEAMHWRSIVRKLVDEDGSAIAAFQAEAYSEWKQYSTQAKNKRRDPSAHREMLKGLAQKLSAAQAELARRFPNSKEAKEASVQFSIWYQKVLRGDDL